ncbi:MAG: hypothetical protein K8T10_00010 [Candidatus Eremiobacteraeota bacterium]|nr:hypothetical protein [Candidatus Eremiobacteraeota bacterium]
MTSKLYIETILHGLPRFHKIPGLSRIKLFIEENNLKYPGYNIVVAGTNGKGSLACMSENILRLSGYDVGVLRSPHIYDPCERISFNSQYINETQFAEIIRFCIDFYRERKIRATLADITTACALYYFSEVRTPDISIFEVGMGGKLDPANIVPRNISIITKVGRDHTGVLGEYPEGPARAKSGVIKPDTPLLTAESNQDAIDIFKKACLKNGSDFINVHPPEITGINDKGTEFVYNGRKYLTSMVGYEQGNNAVLALEALDIMRKSGFNIPDTAVAEGLIKSRLPWRMEVFSGNPMIIFDGAHNREGWENLKCTLQLLPYKNLHMIFTVGKSKHPEDFPRNFPGEKVFLHIPQIDRKNYFGTQDIFKKIHGFRGEKIVYDNLESAIKNAIKKIKPGDLLLVTGSFGMAREVRDYFSKHLDNVKSKSMDM